MVASADRIYVLDNQIATVRVYDLAGRHLMDIGGRGQGPGEFMFPEHLAIDPDGTIFVRDGALARLTIFEPSGAVRDTWPLPGDARAEKQPAPELLDLRQQHEAAEARQQALVARLQGIRRFLPPYVSVPPTTDVEHQRVAEMEADCLQKSATVAAELKEIRKEIHVAKDVDRKRLHAEFRQRRKPLEKQLVADVGKAFKTNAKLVAIEDEEQAACGSVDRASRTELRPPDPTFSSHLAQWLASSRLRA